MKTLLGGRDLEVGWIGIRVVSGEQHRAVSEECRG